jgi:hypothetical protein
VVYINLEFIKIGVDYRIDGGIYKFGVYRIDGGIYKFGVYRIDGGIYKWWRYI